MWEDKNTNLHPFFWQKVVPQEPLSFYMLQEVHTQNILNIPALLTGRKGKVAVQSCPSAPPTSLRLPNVFPIALHHRGPGTPFHTGSLQTNCLPLTNERISDWYALLKSNNNFCWHPSHGKGRHESQDIGCRYLMNAWFTSLGVI